MSNEDTIRGLKLLSTVTLGHFAGAAIYTAAAVQPSLIKHDDVVASSKVMRGILSRSSMMPLCAMTSSATALAVYFKTRGTNLEDNFWLISGGTMLALIPYTVKFIGPINEQFRKNPEPTFSGEDEKWKNLLSDWLTFHTPRALIAVSLFSIGIYKIIK